MSQTKHDSELAKNIRDECKNLEEKWELDSLFDQHLKIQRRFCKDYKKMQEICSIKNVITIPSLTQGSKIKKTTLEAIRFIKENLKSTDKTHELDMRQSESKRTRKEIQLSDNSMYVLDKDKTSESKISSKKRNLEEMQEDTSKDRSHTPRKKRRMVDKLNTSKIITESEKSQQMSDGNPPKNDNTDENTNIVLNAETVETRKKLKKYLQIEDLQQIFASDGTSVAKNVLVKILMTDSYTDSIGRKKVYGVGQLPKSGKEILIQIVKFHHDKPMMKSFVKGKTIELRHFIIANCQINLKKRTKQLAGLQLRSDPMSPLCEIREIKTSFTLFPTPAFECSPLRMLHENGNSRMKLFDAKVIPLKMDKQPKITLITVTDCYTKAIFKSFNKNLETLQMFKPVVFRNIQVSVRESNDGNTYTNWIVTNDFMQSQDINGRSLMNKFERMNKTEIENMKIVNKYSHKLKRKNILAKLRERSPLVSGLRAVMHFTFEILPLFESIIEQSESK